VVCIPIFFDMDHFAFVCLQNDVSRLVDISRHTIFFESFTDLTMCLGEIVTDFDVKVQSNPRCQALDTSM